MCVILFKPELKKNIKSFLDEGGVPSQFITAKKLGGKLSLGVFSNLLKQMNAKVKLDLYSVNLPLFRNTMLIGIDVIMQGNAKLIGCCATYNQQMTQVYSQLYKHKTPQVSQQAHEEYKATVNPRATRKDVQEFIITQERSEILKTFVNEAMGVFKKHNN